MVRVTFRPVARTASLNTRHLEARGAEEDLARETFLRIAIPKYHYAGKTEPISGAEFQF